MDDLDILCCPCARKAPLRETVNGFECGEAACPHAGAAHAFFRSSGKPVLIAFESTDTVCERERYMGSSPYVARRTGKLKSFLRDVIWGRDRLSETHCRAFVTRLRSDRGRAKVLVIGAGTRGDGTQRLWDDPNILVTGIDIYASESIDYIADAHYLPFRTETFDGVWIQAVLEHVLDPGSVVGEIHRVLREGGLVYAETPFMQQVHEGAYDFTRFTVLGHRYLFRAFESIGFGPIRGPGYAFAWSARYLAWAVSRSRRFALVIGIPFVLVGRVIDELLPASTREDGCSGSFFFGLKRRDHAMKAIDMPKLYRGLQ